MLRISAEEGPALKTSALFCPTQKNIGSCIPRQYHDRIAKFTSSRRHSQTWRSMQIVSNGRISSNDSTLPTPRSDWIEYEAFSRRFQRRCSVLLSHQIMFYSIPVYPSTLPSFAPSKTVAARLWLWNPSNLLSTAGWQHDC